MSHIAISRHRSVSSSLPILRVTSSTRATWPRALRPRSSPSGTIRPGDEVQVLSSGKRSRVRSVTTYDGDLNEAFAPMSVTVCLEDEIDISRGDMLAHAQAVPHASRNLEATLVWMHATPLE